MVIDLPGGGADSGEFYYPCSGMACISISLLAQNAEERTTEGRSISPSTTIERTNPVFSLTICINQCV